MHEGGGELRSSEVAGVGGDGRDWKDEDELVEAETLRSRARVVLV